MKYHEINHARIINSAPSGGETRERLLDSQLATPTPPAHDKATGVMIIRIRSKDGQFRITVEASDDASKLGVELQKQLPQIDLSTLTLSNQPRGAPEMKLNHLSGTSIADLGLR